MPIMYNLNIWNLLLFVMKKLFKIENASESPSSNYYWFLDKTLHLNLTVLKNE